MYFKHLQINKASEILEYPYIQILLAILSIVNREKL